MQFKLPKILTIAVRSIKLLDPDDKKQAYISIALSIVNSVLELLSLASMLPILIVLIKGEALLSFKFELTNEIIITVLVLLVVLFVLKNVTGMLILKYQLDFLGKISNQVSKNIFSDFFRKNWIEYASQNSADTWRKVSNTSEEFTQYILHSYLNLVTEILISVPILLSLVYYDIHVFVGGLLFFIPVLLLHYLFKRKVSKKIETAFRKLAPVAAGLLYQGLDSFIEAKIYKKESFFINRYIDIRKLTIKNLNQFKLTNALPTKIFETVGIAFFAGIIVYAILNDILTDDLILHIGLIAVVIYRIMPACNKILIATSQINAYRYTIDELKLLHCEDRNMEDLNARRPPFKFHNIIEIAALNFGYNGQPHILNDLNLKITKGQFVLLEGPSGSGKTTLLNLLSGLIEMYEGVIKIDGVVLSPKTVAGWQSHLGVVTQQPLILEDSFLQNILFGQTVDNFNQNQFNKAIRLACLDSFLNSLPAGLQTRLGEHGHNISGGQSQRIALARALYRNPSVLLLDEFTNQLDSTIKETILKGLKNEGFTIIVSSHDEALLAYADQIVNLKSLKTNLPVQEMGMIR